MNKTIKSIAALAVSAALMTAMTACTPKDDGGNAPQLISGGTAATVASQATDKQDPTAPSASSDTYGFVYKGVLLTPGMDADAAIKALGEGYVKSPDIQSCAFNGIETSYDYKDIVLFVDNRDGGNYKINTIDVRDPSVDCGGIKLGSSMDDVKKVYGEPTSKEIYGLCYEKNHTQIQFISVDEKTVSSILFKSI
ncbi:MAG: hypothetical protein E7386_04195 [Ruminococcaceae bacterium]|nr:hypothetical protein [Oscillospiraceae bacterium]